eukprot:3775235-Prymnesium_polylepis.1
MPGGREGSGGEGGDESGSEGEDGEDVEFASAAGFGTKTLVLQAVRLHTRRALWSQPVPQHVPAVSSDASHKRLPRSAHSYSAWWNVT